MKKRIHSYYIAIDPKLGDIRRAMYLLSAEYANRKGAEAALKELRELVLSAQVSEWDEYFDANDPEELKKYQHHLVRLVRTP